MQHVTNNSRQNNFPEEVKNVIKAHDDRKKRVNEVETLFFNNETLLEEYRIWSKSHAHLITLNNDLYDINRIASKVRIYKIIKIGFLSSFVASVSNRVYLFAVRIFEVISFKRFDNLNDLFELQNCGVLSSDSFENSKAACLLQSYIVRNEHIREGDKVPVQLPAAADMSNVQWVKINNNIQHTQNQIFYGFIPVLIAAAQQNALNAGKPLSGQTVKSLQVIESRIRSNSTIRLMKQQHDSRIEQYKIFCCYLSQIIISYKLGQEGGDINDKNRVLNEIASVSNECFPRWMETVEQIYATRPREIEETIQDSISLRDRLLEKLRIERKYILGDKPDMLIAYNVNTHKSYPSFHAKFQNLDLFRVELGTHTDPYNDPSFPASTVPQSARQKKLQIFYKYYTKEAIEMAVRNHINNQKSATPQIKDGLELRPEEVEEFLKNTTHAQLWRKEEYGQVAMQANKMNKEGKTFLEIEAYLKTFGIEWRTEESVRDALDRLNLQIGTLKRFIDSYPRVNNELMEIAKIQNEEERSIEFQQFMKRQGDVLKKPISNIHDFDKEFFLLHLEKIKTRDHLNNIQKEVAGLEYMLEPLEEQLETETCDEKKVAIQTEIEGVSAKIKLILTKHNRITLGQSLDEVLDPKIIENARINDFIEKEIYNADRKFTAKAIICFLESMSILKPNSV